jgi:hypothetical protein
MIGYTFMNFAKFTHDVNNNILVEGVAPLSSDIANMHHRLGIIAIDVEDRSVHHPSNICKEKNVA